MGLCLEGALAFFYCLAFQTFAVLQLNLVIFYFSARNIIMVKKSGYWLFNSFLKYWFFTKSAKCEIKVVGMTYWLRHRSIYVAGKHCTIGLNTAEI